MKEDKKFKILFIDDEPASLTAFKSVFRDYYDIRLASSAEEGYEIMKKENVDIVISDQRMPGITGVEFLHRIRVEFPGTVRMLITGYSDIDAVIQSINGSMVSYYFSKPYNESDMKVILDNTIEKIKLLKENQTLLEKLQSLVKELTEQKGELEQEIDMRRKAENELTHAREKAEESSRLKSSLLANLNHEFRTPMNSILGFSDLIQNFDAGDEVKEMAGIINFSGKRLLKTLNAIVDLARLEADQKTPNIEEVNLSELSSRILNDFRDIAKRKNIRLIDHIQPDVCTLFHHSFASLIITNLIDNALKFTRKGTVEITLVKEQSGNTEQAVFNIKDSGIGIPAAYHETIFDEFRQVSEGFGRYYEGLGIGLALSKKLLIRLKGKISLESEEGKGSLFRVHFPSCLIPLPDSDHIPETGISVACETVKDSQTSQVQLKTVLSVEDNEYNQELIEMFLVNSFEISKVFDGESAVRFASEKQVDVILMDINLGAGIDGVEAMKKIRKINGYMDIPIIAVTGYTSDADKQNLLSAGFDEFLPKPFTKQNLETIIRQSLLKTGGDVSKSNWWIQ